IIPMKNVHPKGVLERGAAPDLWRNTLSQIPSVFGRLVYLSSLRSSITGRYEHHGLALVFGEVEADRALGKSHTEAFSEWLSYNIEHQKADLDLYFSGLPADRRTVVETWARLAPHKGFIPASALKVEEQLYMADFEALLDLLKNEYGVASLDRGA
ncbi:MAG: hypothetical protein ACRD7E_03780, partial [Bryobacteraceae bacterium]